MEPRKVALGALFLFVSSLLFMQTDLLGQETPLVFAALASLGLAGGSLLVGAVGEA